jgi:hypothetical protein
VSANGTIRPPLCRHRDADDLPDRPAGIINKRWRRFVLVAKLDVAIRALEGRRPGEH